MRATSTTRCARRATSCAARCWPRSSSSRAPMRTCSTCATSRPRRRSSASITGSARTPRRCSTRASSGSGATATCGCSASAGWCARRASTCWSTRAACSPRAPYPSGGELAERDIPFEAQIIGPDGDHADELRGRIAELGLEDRVLLPGRMGQTDLCDAFRRADIFCMPCKGLDNNDRDGIPNVLVEAMASGAPIVSTPVSGIPELVTDGDNGLLVTPGDPEALADALVRIEDDRALAERLGRRAQETIKEHFDGRNSAARLAALFRESAA